MVNRGQFKVGHQTWNKGLKGYMGANRTSFAKGNLPHNTNGLGTVTRWERLRRSGYREVAYIINIDWKGARKPHNSYKWYLWEVDNQQDRPDNTVICIKNGNPDDLRVENFELITRAELLKRNRGNI